MTMMGGRFPQGSDDVGQTVASFPTYEAAQKAVSSLIAGEVPARDIAIVGQGLRSVERITGRLGYASAARSGAINGVLLGLLFSAILVIGSPSVPMQAFVGVLFVGIAIGMLLSIITYSFVRRRRDYASVMQVVADHYEVTVTAAGVHRARQILGPQAAPEPPTAGPVAEERVAPDEPPRYGERVSADQSASAAPAPEASAAAASAPEASASEADGDSEPESVEQPPAER
ncbi:general stress protein [Microbacterium sp. SSM24]|uniref:general stress protein n=1 Tax=Microbacterium sp. SSM24 TaxID=2991714 RepID=UPI002227A9E2|nr:general stress protein [Microbacterium sp. SSM24]MCW3494089.1 hypothetical protein [Microbacterium sp. SSM24]